MTLSVVREGRTLTIQATLGGTFPGIEGRSEFQNNLGGPLSVRRFGFPVALQHDTVLRPDECGGPVVDLDGRIVGFNVARAGRTESYAIPTIAVREVLDGLMTSGLAALMKIEKEAADAPQADPTSGPAPETPPTPVLPADEAASAYADEGYHLVWADEFDHEGAPNPANWTYETGFVRNEELQWYQPENAHVAGGLLDHRSPPRARGQPEVSGGFGRLAAQPAVRRVHVGQRHDARPPRVAVRPVRDACAHRHAPRSVAGVLDARHGRPLAGERGGRCDGVLPEPAPGQRRVGSGAAGACDLERLHARLWRRLETAGRTTFHDWRMDWDPDAIVLSVDGRVLNQVPLDRTIDQDGSGVNPFHQPHYVILNLAIGATGGDASATAFPARYEIDYVRVYQK